MEDRSSQRERLIQCLVSGQPNSSYLAHEMLHYTTGKNDRQLADDLGVQRRGNEDYSAALSRYINSGCDPAQK